MMLQKVYKSKINFKLNSVSLLPRQHTNPEIREMNAPDFLKYLVTAMVPELLQHLDKDWAKKSPTQNLSVLI